MRELYLSELRRFRTLALIGAGVHLMAMVFACQTLDLTQQRFQLHGLMAAIYMAGSLGFALYQFGSYRAPGRWTWLMHRPLPPTRIFAAIAGASVTLLLGVVALPMLATLAGTDLVGGRVVDMRHYLGVLHIVLLCLASWLAGGYVILNRRRSAAVVLILPVLVFFRLGSAIDTLVPELLCVALLAYILSGVFKPNHAAPPATAARLFTTALPLLMCFYIVTVWGGSTLYQWGQILTGTHPLNSDAPPPGGYIHSVRMDSRTRMLLGLNAAANEEARRLASQVKAITRYSPDVDQYPVRHQASNAEPLLWPDAAGNLWRFSHDDMRYRGRHMLTQQPAGYFGVGGKDSAQEFAEVPVEANGYLLTPHTLYRITNPGEPLEVVFATRGNEQITMAPDDVQKQQANRPLPRYRYVLTNARLVALDLGSNAEQFSVHLPAAYSDLAIVDVAETDEGTLISLLFGDEMDDGVAASNQYITLANPGVPPREIAVRPLLHDFGTLFGHRDFWVSPVMKTVLDLPNALIDNGAVPNVIPARIERNTTVWTAAAITALLSAVIAALWLGRTDATARRKAGWIVACLLLGLPALLTMMVLQPRKPRPYKATVPAAAATA